MSVPTPSPETLAQERALLLPLRRKHAGELLRSGIIDRILAAHSGQGFVPAQINESDVFVPFRMPISDQTIRRIFATDGRSLPLNPEEDVTQPSYALHVHRTSQEAPTYNQKTYFVGDLASETLAAELKTGPYLPGLGMRSEDVEIVAAQLDEVAAAVKDRGLSTVSAETLLEDGSTYHIPKPTLP
jgi:hypothetical protein